QLNRKKRAPVHDRGFLGCAFLRSREKRFIGGKDAQTTHFEPSSRASPAYAAEYQNASHNHLQYLAARSALATRAAKSSYLLSICFLVVIIMIWFHARKARRACGAAGPFVFGDLRELTKRSLERNALRWIIIHVFRGDERVGCTLIFDPLIERRENIVRS